MVPVVPWPWWMVKGWGEETAKLPPEGTVEAMPPPLASTPVAPRAGSTAESVLLTVALREHLEPGAQRVLVVHPPAGVGLLAA